MIGELAELNMWLSSIGIEFKNGLFSQANLKLRFIEFEYSTQLDLLRARVSLSMEYTCLNYKRK